MTVYRIDDFMAQRRFRWRSWLRFSFRCTPDFIVTPPVIRGKLEKNEIVLAYPQASGVFTPIFVASEAGLFKKYGLNVKLQQLNPQLVGASRGFGIGGYVGGGGRSGERFAAGRQNQTGRQLHVTVRFSALGGKRNHRRAAAQGQNSRRHDAAFGA